MKSFEGRPRAVAFPIGAQQPFKAMQPAVKHGRRNMNRDFVENRCMTYRGVTSRFGNDSFGEHGLRLAVWKADPVQLRAERARDIYWT